MSKSLSNTQNYLPISEAAKFLGVSQDTLRRWDKTGIIKSKRLDGKNRYFALVDLKKNKSNRPLSISEVSKKLNISATTLRRLEARGIITPSRNKAGERVFTSANIEAFLKSGYFKRKKYTFKKQPTSKIDTVVKSVKEAVKKDDAMDTDLDSNPTPKPFLGNFLAVSTASFILLATVGLGNVFLFKTQNYEVLPMVLGETFTAPEPVTSSPLIPAAIESEAEQTSSISAQKIQIEEPASPLEKYIADSLKMINERKRYQIFGSDSLKLAEIATDSAIIRQSPNPLSPMVGSAKTGDIFEFLSFDSGWVELNLHESTPSGFIEEQYVTVKQFDFSSSESGGWADVNQSLDQALTAGPVATGEGQYDQISN